MRIYIVLVMLSLVVLSQTGCPAIILGGAAKAGSMAAQERSVGETVDDTSIWTQIKSLYLQKNVDQIFSSVNVEVKEGRVLLTGRIDNPEHRVEAVRLAWQPVGVKEVINELQITDKSSLRDEANDYWINTQIRTKLLLEKNVRSINYTPDTVNGVVYLIGIAQNDWEMKQAALVASKVKGVKRVVSYVRVKQNPTEPPKKKPAVSTSISAPSALPPSSSEPEDIVPSQMTAPARSARPAPITSTTLAPLSGH